MAGGSVTTKKATPSSAKGQKSILGFFQKKAEEEQKITLPIGSPKKKSVQKVPSRVSQILTPLPSSDAIEEDEDEDVVTSRPRKRFSAHPTPATPASFNESPASSKAPVMDSSPSRKVSHNIYCHANAYHTRLSVLSIMPSPVTKTKK
jgi:hypothetical protein